MVAGLNADPGMPGYKHIVIRPRPEAGLSFARVRYESLYGMIETGWRRKDSTMPMHILIPPNTTAMVVLPSANLQAVLDNPMCEDLRAAAQIMEQTSEGVQLEIGSGEYTVEYCIYENYESAG